jgi:hypothetical protein
MKINKKAKMMKMISTALCGEFVVVLMILLAISKVDAQSKGQSANASEEDCDCIKVSLTADSNRLEKKNPIFLLVRVENLCDRTIEILEPVFTIDKSVIKGDVRFGDRRGGRIIRNSEIDNALKTVDPGKYLEFPLDTNELRWMDSMSSIEVFKDLFTDHDLKTGSYLLYCEVVVYPTSKQHYKEKGGKVRRILSNKIEVQFEKVDR